ncbi:MAG: prepilin-type N-terminal cleavage/methylation domain-containing protein [Sphingobacteriia bacterium]|nr:prepilin-type N-terminal cleavage/methylation domain-containing protein [Sphingobacteriia bacterium]
MIKKSLFSFPFSTGLHGRLRARPVSARGVAPVRRERVATSGFTLVELMVTLTLLVILVAIGVPSFRTYTANSATTDAANLMLGAISQARHEAVTRGLAVCLCQSDDGSSCGDSTAWESGWILIERACSSPSEVLGVQPPIGLATIVGESDTTAIDFTSRGYLLDNSVEFTVSAPQGTRTRHVCVSRIGLAQVQEASCS